MRKESEVRSQESGGIKKEEENLSHSVFLALYSGS